MADKIANAKTIQIVLPDGDPRGLRKAQFSTGITHVVEVPRELLDQFLHMPEATQVAVYFLFGDDPEGGLELLYIGQTTGIGSRLSQHKEKSFWKRAVVVVSLTNILMQTHACFLEWLSIKEAKNVARYAVQNEKDGSRPQMPVQVEADCFVIYNEARVLMGTLGYPVFEPALKQPIQQQKGDELFCTRAGTDGRGVYTSEGFVVLKGSSGRAENLPSIKGTSDEKFRQRLIEQGVMRVEGDRVAFDKDHLFGSPSMAAVALTGGTANGWIEWKNAEGKTLKSLKQLVGPT